MRATQWLPTTRSSLILATVGAGIALGAIGVLHETYTPQPPLTTVSHDIGALPDLPEDDPAWDCATMGNEVCHALDAAAAWEAWDRTQNALELGSQSGVRIEYVGKSDVPVPGHMLVDGYLFRIIYPTI